MENQTSSFPFTVKIFAKWLLVHIDTVQHHSKNGHKYVRLALKCQKEIIPARCCSTQDIPLMVKKCRLLDVKEKENLTKMSFGHSVKLGGRG